MGKQKKIKAILSDKANEYFEEIADTLDSGGKKGADDSQVINYVLETLMLLEKAVGDPITFLEDISTGHKMIVHKFDRPKIRSEQSIKNRTIIKDMPQNDDTYEEHPS